VTGLRDRSGLVPREVYDLTVDELHSFYVGTEGARPQDVLVHNCTDIVADEGVEGAHTLGDHVRATDSEMAAKARKAQGGVATRWASQEIAAEAVDKAMKQWIAQPGNAGVLESWMNKQAQRIGKKIPFLPTRDLKTIRWEVRDMEGPLGKKWVKKGDEVEVHDVETNWVSIQLKYVGKPHKGKYVVYTSYLEK